MTGNWHVVGAMTPSTESGVRVEYPVHREERRPPDKHPGNLGSNSQRGVEKSAVTHIHHAVRP